MPKKIKRKSLGQKIARLRNSKGISLDTLANETGYSIDHIKSIEADEVIPTVAQLLNLGRALDLESGELLKDEEENNAAEARQEAVRIRTDHYSYRVLTPETGHKHLKGFHITIDPKSEHKGASYQHEGEKFHYVLKGRVQVVVGEHVNELSPGDSLHFNSALVHKLTNLGDEPAEIVVVLYIP